MFTIKSQFEVSVYLVRVWPSGPNSTKDLSGVTNTKQLYICAYCSDSDRSWRHLHVGHQSAANQSSACYCKSPPIVRLVLCVVDVASVFCIEKIDKSHEKLKATAKFILLTTIFQVCAIELHCFNHHSERLIFPLGSL